MAYTQTGTPYYASPEIWLDKPYDFKSDIWYLNSKITEQTGYKYALDIIDHFSKWNGGYLLKTKSAKRS